MRQQNCRQLVYCSYWEQSVLESVLLVLYLEQGTTQAPTTGCYKDIILVSVIYHCDFIVQNVPQRIRPQQVSPSGRLQSTTLLILSLERTTTQASTTGTLYRHYLESTQSFVIPILCCRTCDNRIAHNWYTVVIWNGLYWSRCY